MDNCLSLISTRYSLNFQFQFSINFLIVHAYVCLQLTGTEWSSIAYGHTEKGKPMLEKPAGLALGLNASHQGDYTVFATSCSNAVGVDVMRLDMARKWLTWVMRL